MRISDWSADVCSSDLRHVQAQGARFDEDDGRYAVDRGREVARLYRARRGRGAEYGRVGPRAVQARGAVRMSEVDEQLARSNNLHNRTSERTLSLSPARRERHPPNTPTRLVRIEAEDAATLPLPTT